MAKTSLRKRMRPTVHFGFSGISPTVDVSFSLEETIDPAEIDERIGRLDTVKHDLEGALVAVNSLKVEALENREEAEKLRRLVGELENQKTAAETILRLPKDAVTDLLGSALAKGRIRGLVEGFFVGLASGAISSYVIWRVTQR